MEYLSFTSLSNKGRLGNQMFQIASTIGLAEKHNLTPAFPPWHYASYFKKPLLNLSVNYKPFRTIRERHFHYYDWQFPETPTYSIDLDGYLQSEKYFNHVPFEWADDFLRSIHIKYGFMTELKETLCVQVRRGDLVGHKNYYQLPVAYFILAITSFENWRNMTIVFISDDLDWCKLQFGCLPNAVFPSGSDIEHMCLGSLCDNFVLSNSTFGWWIARLAEESEERKGVRVVHPGHVFAGELATNDTKDYWPDRWVRLEQDNYKFDLTDITFTIPVFYDQRKRKKQNLDLSISILQSFCDTNIIIGEQAGSVFKNMGKRCKYVNFPLKEFHCIEMLNDMVIETNTPYVVYWDFDVIVTPMQLLLTALKLREGAEMIYLYGGAFIQVSTEYFKKMNGDCGKETVELESEMLKKKAEYSIGGAVFFNKKSFVNANEYKKRLYYSVHPELYKIKIEEFRKSDTNYERIIKEPVSVLSAIKILGRALISSLGVVQK